MAEVRDFKYEEGKFSVDQDVKKAYSDEGFIIVRNILSQQELEKVTNFLEANKLFVANAVARDDGHGLKAKLTLWNHPGNDVTGMVARSEKIVNTMEELMSGEVYHYHTKLMLKEAFTGGSFLWHQDYGYWYENGCLFPDMATVFIAIDKADRENGCLQVLRGSHRAGRVDHIAIGNQVAADPERVKQMQAACELMYMELEPGDAAFFHCNLLHKSNQNLSSRRRWAFLCAYNKASNNPIIAHHHPQYTPLVKVPNSAILSGKTELNEEGKWFFKSLSEDLAQTKMSTRKAEKEKGAH